MAASSSAGVRSSKELSPPAPIGWWRNAGRRLGVLVAPGVEEAATYFEPGVVFAAVRVATLPDGRRYLQLHGGGWVPERSRKDPSKVVAVPVSGPTEKDTIAGEIPASSAAVARGEGATGPEANGEAPLKKQRLTVEEVEKAPLPPSPSMAVRVRHLRVTVLATRSLTNACMQFAEVALRCRGEILSMADFAASSPNSSSPVNEGPERLLMPCGKFLDSNFRTHGQTVIMLTASREIDIEDIALRTSNDQPARDPTYLVVDGSRDGRDWKTLLDTGADLPTPQERRVWTPWFALEEQGPAKLHVLPEGAEGVRRFYCTARPCPSFQASCEGYIVEGKLLWHMLRDHPRSVKTTELAEKLRSAADAAPRARRKSKKEKGLPVSPNASPGALPIASPGAASSAAATGDAAVKRKREALAAESSSSSSSSSSSEEEEEAQQPALPVLAQSSATPPARAAPASAEGSHPETPRRNATEGAAKPSLLTPSPPVARAAGLSQPMRSVLARVDGSHAAEVVDVLAGDPSEELLEALAGMSPLPSPLPASQGDEASQGEQERTASDAVTIVELDNLRRYPAVEGTVMRRWEPQSDGSFRVQIRDPSGAVDVNFLGTAAEAFRGVPALQEGSCVRIEGYDIVPAREGSTAETAGRRYELLIGCVHAGVCVSAPDSDMAEAEAAPASGLTHLRDIDKAAIGESIDVEAIVQFVGRLSRWREPAKPSADGSPAKPGALVVMRPFVLRQGRTVCSLVLRGKLAEGNGAALLSRRAIVRGTRVIEFKGRRHLSGWRRLEFCSDEQPSA